MGSSSDSDPFQLLAFAVIAAFILILASFATAALAALGEHRLEAYADGKEGGPPGARRIALRPDSTRLALFLFDWTAKLALGGALGWLFASGGAIGALERSAWILGAVVLFLAVVALRGIASRHPKRSFAWAAPVAAGMEMLGSPLVAPLVAVGKRLQRVSVEPPGSDDTTEALEYLIEKSSEAGSLDADKRALLESVIDFTTVRVREIMVPRPKIVALPLDASQGEAVRVILDSGYSRIPVYDESIDQVVGILYAKRLLEELRGGERPKKRFRLADHLAVPFFVPETMRISQLLTEFKRRRLQMALVVDEFGGTAGVVTLEDVVEEIVGEIRDESDRETQEPIRTIGDGVLVAEGSVSIRDFEDFLEEALPDAELEFPKEGEFDTLGGFVTAMAGHVPALGEKVRHGDFVFTVRGADEKRVAKVEIAWEAPRDARSRETSSLELEAEVRSPVEFGLAAGADGGSLTSRRP